MSAVPAAAPARSSAQASANEGQASEEFPGLIAALLASAMPAALEGTADPTAAGSGGKSKTNPGVPGRTARVAKKQSSVLSGLVVPGASPAAAPLPKPAQAASGDAKKAPAKGAPASATPEAATQSLDLAVPAAALIPLPAVAPAANPSPGQPKGSPDQLRTQEAQVSAALAPPVPGQTGPAATPAQPQTAAPDASRSSAALPATTPEEAPPNPAQPPVAKTELAFAARLTDQTSESAAADGPSQAASAAKNDAAAIPAPPSAAEAASTAASLGAHSIRPASSKEPEKATPENSSGLLEPAGARLDTPVPAAPGPLLRSTAQPLTEAKPIAPSAPLDMEPARAQAGPQPVRQLSLVIPQTASDGGQQEAVEVRLLDTGGQLHVAVRSSDAGLNQSLGNQLGDLVTQLEHSGYRAETWRPVVSATDAGGVSGVSGTSAQHLRGGTDQEGSSGSGRGNQGGNADDSSKRQRRDPEQTGPPWLDLLEESGAPQTNSERSIFHGFSA